MSEFPSSGLIADAVSVWRGESVLIDQVSCAVQPGKILVVLGPNGAGKSTLVRVLSGEWKADTGDVVLNGRKLNSYSDHDVALRRAVLPQSSPLAFPFLVHEVVMMGRAPHVAGVESAQDRAYVEEAMKRADIAHLAERNYLTLSGGEKQRVHLARVMAQLAGVEGPRYLLLDEPVSSLDMAHQHACLDIAHEMARQGVGVLAVLHDLNLAAMYADEVIWLKRGRAVGTGTPRELFTADAIHEVFGQRVVVLPHPVRDCPMIAAV